MTSVSMRIQPLLGAAPLRLAFALALASGCATQPDRGEDSVAQQSDRLTASPAASASKATLRAKVRRSTDVIEVEVSSSEPFRETAMPPALVIGSKVFLSSRNPPDGRLDTLIFSISPADFDALPDSAELAVGYVSPSARLTPVSVPAGKAAAPSSRASVEQLQPNRARVGKLTKTSLEVSP